MKILIILLFVIGCGCEKRESRRIRNNHGHYKSIDYKICSSLEGQERLSCQDALEKLGEK